MSDKGDSCFPATRTLADDTGLSHRAVLTHLEIAAEEGWIGRRQRLLRGGKGWKRMEYFAVIPKGVKEAIAEEKRGERDSPPVGDEGRSPAIGGENSAHRGERGDANAVKDVHLKSSVKTPTPQKKRFALPDWVPAKAWQDYEEMRRRIGKPMTDKARELAVKKLDDLRAAGYALEAVLDQSVFNSWQGLFEIKALAARGAAPGAGWWSTDDGIRAKAKEIGLELRRGESWTELRARINAALEARVPA